MLDDDFDDDLLAAWEDEEQHALDVLLGALPAIPGSTPPLPHLQAAVARIRAGVADNSWPYNYFRLPGGSQRRRTTTSSASSTHSSPQCFLRPMSMTGLRRTSLRCSP